MEFGSVMVDGISLGMQMEIAGISGDHLSIGISERSYKYLEKVFYQFKDVTENRSILSIKVNLEGGTKTTLVLNQWKGKSYFNVKGNPISFLTGQNVFGDVSLPDLVLAYYKGIKKAINRVVETFRWPFDIKEAIEDCEVYINGMAFACYTQRLDITDRSKLQTIVAAIAHTYSFHSEAYGQFKSAADLLGVRVVKEGDYSIRFDKSIDRHKYYSLALYSKNHELEAHGKKDMQLSWLEDRLRLDLTLTSYWFQKRKLRTLKDIHERYGKDYKKWIFGIFEHYLNELCLPYAFMFPRLDKIDVGNYREWFQGWRKGEGKDPTLKCKMHFYKQGLDVDKPYVLHRTLFVARTFFGMPEEVADRCVFGDTSAVSQWLDSKDNHTMPQIAKRGALLLPDATTSVWSRVGDAIVDTMTGEVITSVVI